jgi:hypothetical protein
MPKLGGILKAKSTPDIFHALQMTPRKPPESPGNDAQEEGTKVKFAYVSPNDKISILKNNPLSKYMSTENIYVGRPFQNQHYQPNEQIPTSSRNLIRSRTQEQLGPGIIRNRRIPPQNEQIAEDSREICDFVNANCDVSSIFTPQDFTNMSILDYFETIKSVASTFRPFYFRSPMRRNPITNFEKTKIYSTMTLELAKELELLDCISSSLLFSPMTQMNGCQTTKKKLAFLRKLVQHAESRIEMRRNNSYVTRRRIRVQPPIGPPRPQQRLQLQLVPNNDLPINV